MQRLFKLLAKNIKEKRQNKKGSDKKVRLKPFKQSLKLLFINKNLFIFFVVFLLGNIGLYGITYSEQKSLALSEKVYESNIDLFTVIPEQLLSDKFNSEPYTSTSGYGYYAFLFFGLILGVEIFVLASIISFRRHYPKRYLLLYFFVMQLFTLLPVLLITFTPNRVIADLNSQAKIDISQQINLLSNNEGRKQLSIKSTPEEIRDSIIQSSNPPKVIDEQSDSQAIIQSLQIQDKDTLYRVVIIPSYVLAQEGLSLNFDAYLFSNNILVIKQPSRDLLTNILPSFTGKIIKVELGEVTGDNKSPKFSILSEDAYNLVQTQKSEKIKIEFLNYISGIKLYLADANKYIPILQADKKSLEEERVSYKSRTDRILSECRTSYGIEDCRPVEDEINKNTTSIESDLRIINDKLQGWLDLRPKLAYALQLTQAAYEKFTKFPITPELQDGVFNPPDAIYLKYHSEGEYLPSPSDYLVNGLHEYLHYQAYNPSTFLPSFINEGITDYLANKLAQKYSLRQNIPVHYPEEVSIVQELIKTIPETKLLSAYFSQSEADMERFIDEYYSKGTYKELITKGESLTYIDYSDKQAKEQITKEIIELLSTFKLQ